MAGVLSMPVHSLSSLFHIIFTVSHMHALVRTVGMLLFSSQNHMLHRLQVQIRRLPKPVIAMVAGYAVGGGHILHMICDLTVSTHCPLSTDDSTAIDSGAEQLVSQKPSMPGFFLILIADINGVVILCLSCQKLSCVNADCSR